MPNQYTTEPTKRGYILEYVMDHPGCTSLQIHQALGYDRRRICQDLDAMKKMGQLTSQQIPGERAHRYRMIDALPNGNCSKIERRTVQNWTGHKRDELLTAFFGAAA